MDKRYINFNYFLKLLLLPVYFQYEMLVLL
jgi:hypothetical protein